MAFQVGNFKSSSSVDAKKAAIEAAKAASSGAKALGSGESASAIMKYIPAAECADRIRIVFDDSGSMSGEIENAKKGVVEFLRNCIPNQTAVAVHFMCTTAWNTVLRSDLPALGADVEEANLVLGGTPMFNTMLKAMKESPLLTRMVVFTDGSPTDKLDSESDTVIQDYWGSGADTWRRSADVIIDLAKRFGGEKCIPIDTIFFGPATDYTQKQRDLLKYLSDQTGGFFMVFDPAKVNFKTAFKYLAPVNRLQLTSGNFRAALERGEKL